MAGRARTSCSWRSCRLKFEGESLLAIRINILPDRVAPIRQRTYLQYAQCGMEDGRLSTETREFAICLCSRVVRSSLLCMPWQLPSTHAPTARKCVNTLCRNNRAELEQSRKGAALRLSAVLLRCFGALVHGLLASVAYTDRLSVFCPPNAHSPFCHHSVPLITPLNPPTHTCTHTLNPPTHTCTHTVCMHRLSIQVQSMVGIEYIEYVGRQSNLNTTQLSAVFKKKRLGGAAAVSEMARCLPLALQPSNRLMLWGARSGARSNEVCVSAVPASDLSCNAMLAKLQVLLPRPVESAAEIEEKATNAAAVSEARARAREAVHDTLKPHVGTSAAADRYALACRTAASASVAALSNAHFLA